MSEVTGEEGQELLKDTSGNDRGIEVNQWNGCGGAFSLAGASSVGGSLDRKAVPSECASLEHITIRELSERCGLFRARDMSSGDRPNWE